MKKQKKLVLKKVTGKPTHAILYGRVATLGEGPDQRVQDQLRECRKFAKANGYVIDKDSSYKDIYTGLVKYTERQGLLDILKHIDKFPERTFVVIVNDISRIARDEDILDSYSDALRLRGASIESTNSAIEQSAEEQFQKDMTWVMSKYEYNVRSQKAIQALRRKANGK